MLLVGLTGGLASGKSTVARLFQRCGAVVIDADQLARTVVEPRKAAWRDIVKTFGAKVLRKDRTLDRAALASMVFHSPRKLRLLNHIVHPRVAREQARLIKNIAKNDPDALIIYDAALLIEANAHKRMDRVIVVTADQATQIARACKRDGLSRQDALRRIRGQLSLQKKRKHADYVIDGTLPLPQLRKKVQHLCQILWKQTDSSNTHPKRRNIKLV